VWDKLALQIMRAEPQAGWIELLTKETLPSTTELSGPAGAALQWDESKPYSLLIANLSKLPSLIYLAEQLSKRPNHTTLVLIQADQTLPFRPAPCRTMIPGLPAGVIATLPLLNDWGIAVRIASHDDLPGCFAGDVETLAQHWLAAQTSVEEIAVLRLV